MGRIVKGHEVYRGEENEITDIFTLAEHEKEFIAAKNAFLKSNRK